jgi:hypothetical protein
MRKHKALVIALAILAAVGASVPRVARADVSIAIGFPGFSIGFGLPLLPVPVPVVAYGPAYYAPTPYYYGGYGYRPYHGGYAYRPGYYGGYRGYYGGVYARSYRTRTYSRSVSYAAPRYRGGGPRYLGSRYTAVRTGGR